MKNVAGPDGKWCPRSCRQEQPVALMCPWCVIGGSKEIVTVGRGVRKHLTVSEVAQIAASLDPRPMSGVPRIGRRFDNRQEVGLVRSLVAVANPHCDVRAVNVLRGAVKMVQYVAELCRDICIHRAETQDCRERKFCSVKTSDHSIVQLRGDACVSLGKRLVRMFMAEVIVHSVICAGRPLVAPKPASEGSIPRICVCPPQQPINRRVLRRRSGVWAARSGQNQV